MEHHDNVLTFDTSQYVWDQIIGDIYYQKYGFTAPLEELHLLLDSDSVDSTEKSYFDQLPVFGKNDRTSFFVRDFYQYYDSNPIIRDTYYDFLRNEVMPMFGGESLVVQKAPNFRVHVPNTTNIGKRNTDPNDSIIGLHYDGEFGHPPEEINFVLPLTRMFESNSIYYETVPKSETDPDTYKCLTLEPNQLFTGYLNGCRHFNRINRTGKTRVSFDFRVIPLSRYRETEERSATSNLKFTVDNYYVLLDEKTNKSVSSRACVSI